MSDQAQPAGWYHAEGDPPGTTRYWNGAQWEGGPTAAPVAGGAATGGSGMPSMGGMGANQMTLATPGLRMGARIIDFIIMLIITFPLVGEATFQAINNSDSTVVNVAPSFVTVLIAAAIAFLYDFLSYSKLGATPGKLILGMRLADAETGESPVTMEKAARRSANRLLGILASIGSLVAILIGLASLVMLFTDDRNQTVMDKIGGTVVVKK